MAKTSERPPHRPPQGRQEAETCSDPARAEGRPQSRGTPPGEARGCQGRGQA